MYGVCALVQGTHHTFISMVVINLRSDFCVYSASRVFVTNCLLNIIHMVV